MVVYKCVICGSEVIDYEPEYCCSGYMCGCMGKPIDPPICEACVIKESLSINDLSGSCRYFTKLNNANGRSIFISVLKRM